MSIGRLWKPNCPPGLYPALVGARLLRTYRDGEELVFAGALECLPLAVRHDSGATFGFRITGPADLFGAGWSIGYAADLGCWDARLADALSGVDLLALEFNHDVAMQRSSGRHPTLIARVLGRRRASFQRPSGRAIAADADQQLRAPAAADRAASLEPPVQPSATRGASGPIRTRRTRPRHSNSHRDAAQSEPCVSLRQRRSPRLHRGRRRVSFRHGVAVCVITAQSLRTAPNRFGRSSLLLRRLPRSRRSCPSTVRSRSAPPGNSRSRSRNLAQIAKITASPIRIAVEAGHRHQSADLQMRACRRLGKSLGHLRRREAMFGRVARDVHFQQHGHHSPERRRGRIDRSQQSQAIDRVNHRHQRQSSLDFVPLQMADQMPANFEIARAPALCSTALAAGLRPNRGSRPEPILAPAPRRPIWSPRRASPIRRIGRCARQPRRAACEFELDCRPVVT